MSERPINTNDLRDYADRISNPYAQLILDAASELDATRTERNIARRELDKAQARVKRLEGALNLVQENVEASASSYQVRVETISRVVRAALNQETDQ